MLLTLLQFFASKFLVLALHLEAGSFPRPLSPQEEIRAFADLRAGDSSAREKLIRLLHLCQPVHRKCYPLPSALWDGKENPPLSRNDASTSKWIFWSRESGSFFLLQRVSCEGCGLTPLYILQVSLAGPRTTVEAQAFYRMYHSYADIPNPWDRLRWCRYGLDLLQKEVAAMVGMEEWLYRDLESGTFHRSFTPELADKLAALYGIPVEDILDDYTLFLYRGGGAFLRRYREAKGWNRQQLADHAKVSRTSIRCWENGQKTISQMCFCHLVENLGSDFPSMLRM